MVKFKKDSDEFGPLMDMHPHTIGKLTALRSYYRRALPIFSQNSIKYDTQTIIVDAYCGSGKYNDKEGSSGSPVVILDEWVKFLEKMEQEKGKKHSDKLKNSIFFIFNDNDGPTIISLEKRISYDDVFNSVKDNIKFENQDYKDLLNDLLINIDKYGFGSYFIDPYGFSDILVEELAAIVAKYGHEVIVNWMFENIAKYAFAKDANNPSKDHQAVEHLNRNFGNIWRRELVESDDLSRRKNKLTDLFIKQLRGNIEKYVEKAYVQPFMVYKDGNRIWYPMFHASTSPRAAQVFGNATKKVGGNVKKYHPTKTRESVTTSSLDSWFREDTQEIALSQADLEIEKNIKFFKDHFLDLFHEEQLELQIRSIPGEFIRIYPRRQVEGNVKMPMKWINIVKDCLSRYPDNLSILNWNGKRNLLLTDIVIYSPKI